MTVGKLSAADTRRDMLFDLAVARPEGITVEDMMHEFEWGHHEANDAIRSLRMFLGEFDSINFPCDPQGPGKRWIYRLTGSLDDAKPWVANRLGDGESRLRTMHAMMASIVQSSDGRSSDGRRARLIETGLRHLIEDLDNLAVEVQ